MSAGGDKEGPLVSFQKPMWSRFKHDGCPWVAFSEYRSIQSIPSASSRGDAAVLQSWLVLGLIEAVIEKHVPEGSLIKMKGPEDDS
jgi:hypothetical protein